MKISMDSVLNKYNEAMSSVNAKTTGLTGAYKNANLDNLKTWSGDFSDLDGCGEEFPVTEKLVKHLRSDVIKNYVGYWVRKLLALVVILGLPLLLVKKFPWLIGAAVIVVVMAYSVIINDKMLMKPNTDDLKLYNSDCRCFILPIDTKYRVSGTERGIIINELFISLEHDPNYFDFEANDIVMLIVANNGEYRVHKI
jgi:hypothetical protein